MKSTNFDFEGSDNHLSEDSAISNQISASNVSMPSEFYVNSSEKGTGLFKLEGKSDISLSLSLASHFDDDKNSNLFDHIGSKPAKNQESDQSPRVFSCNFCLRKFYSSQALGGHQNTHKRERTMAKRAQRIDAFAQRYSTSMACVPLHGLPETMPFTVPTHFSNTLGVKEHSLIHKPVRESDNNASRVHHGWSGAPIEQHSNLAKCVQVARFNSDFASFGNGGRATPFLSEEADLGWPGSFRAMACRVGQNVLSPCAAVEVTFMVQRVDSGNRLAAGQAGRGGPGVALPRSSPERMEIILSSSAFHMSFQWLVD